MAILIPWLTSRNATQLSHPGPERQDRKREREKGKTAFFNRENPLAIHDCNTLPHKKSTSNKISTLCDSLMFLGQYIS